MAKHRSARATDDVFKQRYTIIGGMLKGYQVFDNIEKIPVSDALGMWDAIHLRDSMNAR